MGFFDKVCKYVSDLTTINESYIALIDTAANITRTIIVKRN